MSVSTLIYGGGAFYSGGSAVIDDLKASGFTTVVAWTIHVASSGDLSFNDTPLVQDGVYHGSSSWPAQLASLKQGTTSVTRLLFSVGSGGVNDFTHIQSLGTAKDGVLYKNFQALLAAIPAIDGIDFDDEDNYDQGTIVGFALMLQSIGYREITFCPYTNTSFWVGCLSKLQSESAGLVTGFNLQCYSGGSGNDPDDWITAIKNALGSGFPAASLVYPGLWCIHGKNPNGGYSCNQGQCPDSIQKQFESWQPDGIQGGFIWLYADIQGCEDSGACSGSMGTAAYASAIINGLQG